MISAVAMQPPVSGAASQTCRVPRAVARAASTRVPVGEPGLPPAPGGAAGSPSGPAKVVTSRREDGLGQEIKCFALLWITCVKDFL